MYAGTVVLNNRKWHFIYKRKTETIQLFLENQTSELYMAEFTLYFAYFPKSLHTLAFVQ